MLQKAEELDETQIKIEESLLCLLPVDGVIQLLHLLFSQDAISEVGLELLHGELPIICKGTNQ